MTLRNQKRLLTLLNLLLIAGVGGVWYIGVAIPVAPPQGNHRGSVVTSPEANHAENPSQQPPLEDFAVIYSRDLRKPLFDPKPKRVAKPAPPPPPKPAFKLVGTVVEGEDNSLGLFRTRNGETKFKGVGEMIEGAKVLEIREGGVTVQLQGRRIEMKVNKED